MFKLIMHGKITYSTLAVNSTNFSACLWCVRAFSIVKKHHMVYFLRNFTHFQTLITFNTKTLTNNTLIAEMYPQMPPVKRAFSWLNRISGSVYNTYDIGYCHSGIKYNADSNLYNIRIRFNIRISEIQMIRVVHWIHYIRHGSLSVLKWVQYEGHLKSF